ncbi:hypothetical protein AAHC03_01062 [Spirometra sp. Aus1]
MILGSVSGVPSYPVSVHPRRVIKPYVRMRNSSVSTLPYSEQLRNQQPSYFPSRSGREEELLAKLVRIHGTDWDLIARHFPPCGTRTPTELRALWNQYRQTSAITVQQARHFRRKNCYQGSKTPLSTHRSSDFASTGPENLCMQNDAHSAVQGNRFKSFASSPVCPLQDLNLTSAVGPRRTKSSHADSSVSIKKDFDAWLDTTSAPSPKLGSSGFSVKRSSRGPDHRPSSIRRLESSLQKHYSPDHSPSFVSPACSPSSHKDAKVSAVCSPSVKIKRSSSPLSLSSDPSSTQLSSSFLPPRRSLTPLFPSNCSSDSIALLTAKATVWNRVQTAKEVNNIMMSSGSRRLTYSASKSVLEPVVPRTRRNSSPFAFPVQQQPQLSIRRILQVASETVWRRVALGTSGIQRDVTHLAHHLLDDSLSGDHK